jgi:TRAP transporter TAXI family solute receptor
VRDNREKGMLKNFVVWGVLAAVATPAAAQVVGMGTTQAGATAQLSTVIAKVVSDKGGLQVRPQPMAGVAQYAPLVNAGEIDLGVANLVEARYLVQGREIVERPNPELRLVARLVPWYNGLVVKADSPIKSIRDLKGQPTPAGFSGNPLGRVLMDGYLANAGLKIADTRQVLVPAFPRMFDLFKQGQLATAISTIGSPVLRDWEAAVGPVRFLGFDDSPPAVAALQHYIPGAYVVEVQPGPGVLGIPVPTKLLVYDYVLFAGAKVADDVVARVVGALFDHPADVKAGAPLFKEFEPRLMSKDLGIAYHPGAIRFYQAKGIWPGAK